LALVHAAVLQPAAARAQADAKDWPTYNHEALGSRFNQGEMAIGRDNTGRLEEKWRFPMASGQEIGAIQFAAVMSDSHGRVALGALSMADSGDLGSRINALLDRSRAISPRSRAGLG
jgi:hypothetical protein